MGCDMVVALGQATVDGYTVFGQNSTSPPRGSGARIVPTLMRSPGRAFALGEKVTLDFIEIPQARQTCTVVGIQAGRWGYQHGVNEFGVAAGCTDYRNKLDNPRAGLTGTDLVRLVLERARSARQAVDILAELLERFGQGTFTGCPPERAGDHALLIADGAAAFLVETAAGYWVYQEIQQVRAASDVCTIRQDWDRISPGLAGFAIERGWWPGDGSKLDFADALSANPVGEASALRRWGRATLLLEQQNGHIDEPFLRRLLSDHYEGMHGEVDPIDGPAQPVPLCQHGMGTDGMTTATSMVAHLGRPDRLVRVGCAIGPPCLGVYFPIFLDGPLPEPFTRSGPLPGADHMARSMQLLTEQCRQDRDLWDTAHERFAQLQADFDHEADDFAAEGTTLKLRGERDALAQQASVFMQRCLDRFDAVLADVTGVRIAASSTP